MANTATIMTLEKPVTIDGGRRKELKKAFKKGARTEVKGPSRAEQQELELANLKQLLGNAKTPEEAREFYNELGAQILPQKEFDELMQQQFGTTPPKTEIEPIRKAAKPEEHSQPQKQGKVTIGQEEYPISAYEEAEETPETIALRKVLASEIERLDKKLLLLEELALQTEENVNETIESAILDSKDTPDPDSDIKNIYQTDDGKKAAIDQFRSETWHKLLTLRQIDSGYDPAYELGSAYRNEEISTPDWTRIVEQQQLEMAILAKKEGSVEIEKRPEENLPSETPDLYGFMEKTIQEQAQVRARERVERKKRNVLVDQDEIAASARTRRMARMRKEGMSDEEIGAFEVAETKFEPTSEMLAISEEISRVRIVAEQQLREVQTLGQLDDAAIRTLEGLRFTLRRLESLRTNLRQVETLAKREFEDAKEAAKKLLGRTGVYSQVKPWLHTESKLPEEGFGSKLLKAIKNLVTIKNKPKPTTKKERRTKSNFATLKKFGESVDEAFADGSLPEEEFLAKKQLVDFLAKSTQPLNDLDATYAENSLEGILTEDEYLALRKSLI